MSESRSLLIRRGVDIDGAIRFAICDAAGHPILHTHSYPRAHAHVTGAPVSPRPSRWAMRARWQQSEASHG